jgi:hypothetical protein
MQSASTTQEPDRWLSFLIVTLSVNAIAAFLFPQFVTDAFRIRTALISICPVIWGFALLFVYRSKREKLVAWLGLAGAIYWFIPAVGMPIEFLGR